MLSLLSHEPNFTIIREEVKYKREQVEGIVRNEFIITNHFQFLYLPLLREYLDMEFKETVINSGIEYNLERVIDDIIFFCFFVGNDFLPSLSVLDIAEASVDTLFQIYKATLSDIGDYITENGLIYWDRAEKLIKALSAHELEILHSRMQKIMNFEKRAEDQEAQFFKGVERIQYFRLKEKRSEMILGKKKKLLDRLRKENKDKEYKKNKVANRPRELKRMQLDVKQKDKALKKRVANNPHHYSSNSKKLDFGVLMAEGQDEDEEQDLDWMEDDDRFGDGDEDEEEYLRNQAPEREPKEESKSGSEVPPTKQASSTSEASKEEESKELTKGTDDTSEETISTSKQDSESKTDSEFYEGDKNPDDLSDLSIKDMNDSDVSDVDLEELIMIEDEIEGTLSRDMMVQLKLAEDSRKKNQSFVKNLCERYRENPESAKAYYYKEKVNYDVYTETGKANREEMLRQYLVGMQWVLFYYYKGVQHWGFYYKYHYPPMISDIKDIETLLGSKTIENFEDCKSENKPFNPFEQLLTILPPDSIQNLLPKCYYDNFINNPKFEQFYPLTFDMDLNGRSMPWESIILIPFIDETQLLDHQRELAAEGKLVMDQKDIDRNTMGVEKMYFKEKTLSSYPIPPQEFKGFEFGDKNRCKIVERPPPTDDFVGCYSIDYKTTDTNIVCDFPSMHILDIEKMALIGRHLKGTRFEIPQVYIDDTKSKEIDIDTLAKDFVKRKTDAVYIDYPFQREAFIYCILTFTEYYNVYDCWNIKSVKNLVTETTPQQWYEATTAVHRALSKANLHCKKVDVIVGFNRVDKVTWNAATCTFEKSYKPEVEYLPIQLINLQRDESHYLNLEPRIKDPLTRFESMKKCMVLDETYFGLSAQIKQVSEGGEVNSKFKYYDLSVNNKREEQKVRDLFFAKNITKRLQVKEPKYSGIDRICKKHSKSFLTVNRVTSSILIKYMEGKEKKTVDIGLKLRNNNQKLHIPFDVVYSEKIDPYKTEPVQFWGFSQKAEEVILDYLYTFPWIEHYIEARAHHEASVRVTKHNKHENRMNTLEDALPFLDTDEKRMLELKRLTDWLANCELANRSFVPAGFRFLSSEARSQIEEELFNKKKEKQAEIPTELSRSDPRIMFSEVFPFWCAPYPSTVHDFRFGDRVANINTTRRKYIPFGDIGTVIGTTLDAVIVRFDEPNVSLTDVHDTCPSYTGAVVNPESLMNLTMQAELRHQRKPRQNVRHVEEHKGGYQKQGYGQQQNFREGGKPYAYKGGKQGGYKQGPPAHPQPDPHPKNEEQKGHGKKGFTKYGEFKPGKKRSKNYGGYGGYDY